MNTIGNIYHSNNLHFKGFCSVGEKTANKVLQRQVFYKNILKEASNDVIELEKNSSESKMELMDLLVNKYNQNNFYAEKHDKENVAFLIKIFMYINKPDKKLLSFVSSYKGSFESLSRILSASQNKKEKLAFSQKIYKEIVSNSKKENQNIVYELLESPYSEEYINNYDKFKSYLKLNCDNENAVLELDKMMEANAYDQKVFDHEYKCKKFRRKFPFQETETFNVATLVENDTKPRRQLFESLSYYDKNFDKDISLGADKELLDIYLSTTDENVDLRDKIIRRTVKYSLNSDKEARHQNLAELNVLFQRIDNDKHTKDFLSNIHSNCLEKYKPSDFNNILNNISSLKLNIFKNNALSIMEQCNSKSVVETLKNEIENPFFETKYRHERKKDLIKYGFAKPESLFSKLRKRFQNKINVIRYNLANDNGPIVMARPIITAPKIEAQVISKPIQNVTLTTSTLDTASIIAEKRLLKAKKREETINNVFDIVSKTLGMKTLAKQKDIYGKNATKIRLGLLPEIFASIAETRKVDKAVGKKRSYSSNKDALELYQLINGNNKKFVKYLLNKRNIDKTRMFEVKDIIQMVKRANNKIQADKKLNPEYRARDARRYYNHLYESKIQQFGKVK